MGSDVEIIVGGNLRIANGKRREFIERSHKAVQHARAHSACIDFSVSADPVDPNRVNIFEAWTSEEALQKFRGEGPDDGLFELVESAAVSEYRVSK
ncbi:putative quinol monooxygenase [Flexibacterium corallicola]|uniref:putative quinol monooxygenase n=1 Tax=Flexibacterium corallicola TaxID=3037259 RepID=UPI00286F53B0|nr:antibiotic biosynthesis monooxygenase family protein [Pseudovibrio sp. M1P-2-3]